MITIEIKLLTNKFGGCPWNSASNEGKTEIIPSPIRILRAILSGLYQDTTSKTGEFDTLTEKQKSLFRKLLECTPSYYIPKYTHAGVISYLPEYATSLRNIAVTTKENQTSSRISFDPYITFEEDDSSIFVFFKNNLTSAERQLLSDGLEYLSYLGRSEYAAEWKLLRQCKIQPNCFESDWGEVVEAININCENIVELLSRSPEQLKEDGYRMPPFMKIAFYKLDAVRGTKNKKQVKNYGQVAYLQIDPSKEIPSSQKLRLTNTLHKYLVKATEHPQAIGYYYDESNQLNPKEKLYYLVDTQDDDSIIGIRVLCKGPIEDSVIHALKSLTGLNTQGYNKVKVALLGVSKRDRVSSKTYRTKDFAVPHIEARKTPLRRTTEALFIRSALQQILDKKVDVDYYLKDGFTCADVGEDIGRVRCKAVATKEDPSPFRGNRIGALQDGYTVFLEFEEEVELISIGRHNLFGYGEVEPF